jgi:hypothetical protein
MIFGFDTPPHKQHNTEQVTILKNHSSTNQIRLVRILESKVCQEKITTFEGFQLTHTL